MRSSSWRSRDGLLESKAAGVAVTLPFVGAEPVSVGRDAERGPVESVDELGAESNLNEEMMQNCKYNRMH